MNKTNYASIDLGDYLDRGTNDRTGIFIIQTGATESSAEFSDRRLILLTDLGIIRKVALDGTSSLFVSHLAGGEPAGDVEISVLGRNGNAIWAGRTDATGFVAVPNFAWREYHNEREPIAIVARAEDEADVPPDVDDENDEYEKYWFTRSSYFIWRFMIDERYQKQGYGRQALGLILDFIRSAPARQAKYVWLCYGLDNVVARKLYASIGFKEVPEAYLEEDEEMPAVLEL